MLSAGTAGTVRIDTNILITNLNIDLFVDIRHNIARYERCLAFSCRVERRNTDETVNAFFRFQIPVSVFAVDLECHGLHTGLITVQKVEFLDRKAFAFCPSGVHTVQHAAPVARLGSACTCVQFDDRIVLVKFAGQQGFDADGIEGCLELFHHFRDFRNNGIVILLLSHLNQSFHIFFGGYQFLIRISVLFHAAQLFHLLLRFFGVVPEIGFLHFTL